MRKARPFADSVVGPEYFGRTIRPLAKDLTTKLPFYKLRNPRQSCPSTSGGTHGRVIRPQVEELTAELSVQKRKSSRQSYLSTSDTHKQLPKGETSLILKRNALAQTAGGDFPNKPRLAYSYSLGNILSTVVYRRRGVSPFANDTPPATGRSLSRCMLA